MDKKFNNIPLYTSDGKKSNLVQLESGQWAANVLRADHPNSNKRVYSKEILEKIVEKFHSNKQSGMVGNLGMPEDGVTSFANASHMIMDLNVKGEYLTANISVLNITPEGKVLKQMLADNPEGVEFRTAGIASALVDENGVTKVNEYELKGIHALPKDIATVL